MALVTVQRSPSPSASAETDDHDNQDGASSLAKSPRQRRRRSKSALKKLRKLFNTVRFVTKLKPCFSESYFTVKGAALILPQSDFDAAYNRKSSSKSHGGDIQKHLQAMFSLLRPQDTIKVAVKLEASCTRYLVVVSCIGRQDMEESVILGIDLTEKAFIGLVLPVWAHTHIQLDGDGGFSIQVDNNKHTFKPVSVQAMWSALQSLNKVLKIATDNLYIPSGLTHTWVGYYESKVDTASSTFTEWNCSEDLDRSYRSSVDVDERDIDSIYKRIRTELKLVMMTVDLEEVTCLFLRKSVEEKMGMDLKTYGSYIDKEMMAILGQMDAPSMILDHLYLGSEWNASNLEELQQNGVNYILNISREIDNFFPGILHYMNVREWDVEASNLLPYWEDTYKFINRARSRGGKTLVHCKMGISRSASTVIAYLMKENKWSLQEAFDYTKGKRAIINPNSGFWKQLELYEGILNASAHRESFNKKLAEDVLQAPKEEEEMEEGKASYQDPEDIYQLHLRNLPKDLEEIDYMPEPDTRSADSTEDSTDQQGAEQIKSGKRRHHKVEKEKAESGDYLSSDSESSDYTSSEDLSDGEKDNEMDTKNASQTKFQPIDIPEMKVTDEDGKTKRVMKVEARRCKSESDKHTLTVESVSASFSSRESSSSKFKPDGSWIKLEPDESDKSDMEPGAINAAEITAGEKTDDSKSDDTGLWLKNLESTTNSSVEDANRKDESVLDSKTETDASESESVQTSDSSKVLDPYLRENIPWNPGTVRKQREDIELRYGQGGTSSATGKKMDGSEVGEDFCPGSPKSEDTKDEADTLTEQTGSPDCVAMETDSGVESPKEQQGPCDVAFDDEGEDNKEDQSNEMDVEQNESPQLRPNRRSVYELEEIDLPEGIVRKTRMEIEERNKLTTETPKKELKRSSSLKSRRVTPKSIDRDNERRKTCIALLSPSHADYTQRDSSGPLDKQHDSVFLDVTGSDPGTVAAVSDQASADTDDASTGAALKVYKYVDGEVTLQEGLVRKQTMDIEQKKVDTSGKKLDLNKQEHILCNVAQVDSKQTVHVQERETNQADLSFTDNGHDSLSKNLICGPNVPSVESSLESGDNENIDKSSIHTVKSIKSLYEESGKTDTPLDTGQDTAAGSRNSTQSRPKSNFDSKTLELIREIGSALLNSPSKPENQEESEEELSKKGGLVSHFVQKFERHEKQKPRKEIIIVEKDSKSEVKDKHVSPSKVHDKQSKCDVSTHRVSPESTKHSDSEFKSSPQSPGQKKPHFSAAAPNEAERPESGSSRWSPTSKSKNSESEKIKTSPIIITVDKSHLSENKPNSAESSSYDPHGIWIPFSGESSDHSVVSTEEEEKLEQSSVKSLVGIFNQPPTGKVSPVFGQTIPEDKSDAEMADRKKSSSPGAKTVKSNSLDLSFPSPVLGSHQQHRHSEPNIHLSEKSVMLFDKKLREMDSSLMEVENEADDESSASCSEGQASGGRPKSAELLPRQRSQVYKSDGARARRTQLKQAQTLSESETEKSEFPWEGRRVRKNYGKSHPLAKLEDRHYLESRRKNPFYNTM